MRGWSVVIRSWAAVLTLGVVAVTGCDRSPSGPGDESYTLVTVNGKALPAPYRDQLFPSDVFEATAGALTLHPNGTLTGHVALRCKSPLPPNTGCEVNGDGKMPFEGTYSRADGAVVLGDYWHYPATFEKDRVVITMIAPPSTGFVGPGAILEYRR